MVLENESEVIQDITEFLFPFKESNSYDTIDLYNLWTEQHGILLRKQSLVDIAISFINDAKSLDKSILAESYNIDRDNKMFTS